MRSAQQQHVIEKAYEVFLRHGYAGTTMGDLAKAAGLSRPALCLVFPDKEDIFSAVIECFFMRTDSRIAIGSTAYAIQGSTVFMRPHLLESCPPPMQLTRLFSFLIVSALAPAWPQTEKPDQSAQDHMRLAQQALQSGHPDRAADEFRAVLRADKNNVEARANLGVLEFFAGNWNEAAADLRAAFQAQPSLWRIEALLGIAEKRLGNRRPAEKLLTEAFAHLETSPVRIQAGLELLDILYAERKMEQAVETVRSLERIAPSNVDVLYTAYRVHTDLANQALDALAGLAPDSGRMHQLMAQHLINEGSLPAALDQYEKALRADTKLAGLHYELGETILDSSTSPDALDRAEKEFQAALKENPADANPEYQLGRIYALREDFAAAQQHYARALSLQPDHLWAHLGMGQALVKLNRPDAALIHLLAASRIDPSNTSVHYRLGVLYKQLGRKEDSTREFGEFRKLQQRDEQIQRVFSEMHQRVSRQHEPVAQEP